jgi:chemotaxis protein CheC
MNDSSMLRKEQLDALREVGNIGAGHAANALSQLANSKIMISVPEVKMIPLQKVMELVGPPEHLVAVVYMNLMGDAQGRSLLIFPRQSVFDLVDILMKRSPGHTRFLKEIDCSAIKEVGNILTGAFLTTLADFLNVALIPSVPLMAYDMVGAILEALAVEYGEKSDYLFCIQTEFTDPTRDMGGSFLLVFDRKSLDVVIDKIDLKIKEMAGNKNKSH